MSKPNTEMEKRFDIHWSNTWASYGYNSIPECIKEFIRSELASQKKQWVEEIKGKDRKEHICRFNDGEQNCDCYFEGIDDVLSLLENK